MFVYEWKPAACIKADPKVAAEVFEELSETVGLTPENLVNVSRAEDAPLHKEFEWDNEKAAEKYREDQAGHLIRSIVVRSVPETEEEKPVIVRAYMQAGSENYEPITMIASDEEKRTILLQRALRELSWFKSKYAVLSELEGVIAAIEEVLEVAQ